MDINNYDYLLRFQSTLPREERLSQFLYGSFRFHFNPRSHERSDPLGIIIVEPFDISIHAPTRGATSFSSMSNQ